MRVAVHRRLLNERHRNERHRRRNGSVNNGNASNGKPLSNNVWRNRNNSGSSRLNQPDRLNRPQQ